MEDRTRDRNGNSQRLWQWGYAAHGAFPGGDPAAVSRRARGIATGPVTKVKTTRCTNVFRRFRTLSRRYSTERQRDDRKPKRKPAGEKTPNRAGATPLFRLRAAQKAFGVAPAQRHR